MSKQSDGGVFTRDNVAFFSLGAPRQALDARTVQILQTLDLSDPREWAAARLILESRWVTPVLAVSVFETRESLKPGIDRHDDAWFLSAAAPVVQRLAELGRYGAAGRRLYRLEMPADLAVGMASGALRSMTARAGGIYSPLVDAAGRIQGQARFIPVLLGGAGVAAGPLGWAFTGALVASSIAEAVARERDRQLLREIKSMLEELRHEQLRAEVAALRSSLETLHSAAALMLDSPSGTISSLGLDSGAQSIRTSFNLGRSRLEEWQQQLTTDLDGRITYEAMKKRVPGLLKDFRVTSEFQTKVELAALSAELYRRLLLLQAQEQALQDPDKAAHFFKRALTDQHTMVIDFEVSLAEFLQRLARARLRLSSGLKSSSEANDVLRAQTALAAIDRWPASRLDRQGDLVLSFNTVSVEAIAEDDRFALIPVGAEGRQIESG